MELVLKIGIVISLLFITIQDIKERKVYLFLFLISGMLLGYLHCTKVPNRVFLITSVVNLSIVLLILLE